MKRRSFLKDASMAAAGLAVGRTLALPQAPAEATRSVLGVDPVPLFEPRIRPSSCRT